ncbi:MAG: HDOD domain-containing protein [Opitutales bacterium]|nr:HDOD domain-containing protein [Opitutales bacterium]
MANNFSAREYCRQHLSRGEFVERKVRSCPVVASLRSVNDALTKLTFQDNTTVSEIAEVIGRDISLTARLLRLVNSVFSGLSVQVTNIEEAIFFLGLRQIRQMAMTTRILEEMDAFMDVDIEQSSTGYWRHCIAMAIMSREILTMANGVKDDDQYYITGLLSDSGKLVMLHTFPEELKRSLEFNEATPLAHLERERKEFGFTHADLGALYLEMNNISPEVVETIMFHHEPEKSENAKTLAAGIQLADILARYAGCYAGFESHRKVEFGEWENMGCWQMLLGSDKVGGQYAKASILRSIENLPSLLHGLME